MARIVFDVDNVDQVLGRDLALGTARLDGVPITAHVSAAPELTFGPLRLTVRVGTSAEARTFALLSTTDPDGVLAPPDDPPPVLAFEAGKAWVRYRFGADVGTDHGVPLGPAEASIAASGSLSFADYRAHAATDPARDAIVNDSRAVRVLADPDDVALLAPGDACSMNVAGTLSASVSVSWSDLIASNLNGLLGYLRGRKLLAIDVTGGASVSATVSLSDEFQLVFARTADGRVCVAARKVGTVETGIRGDLGVSARLVVPLAKELVKPVLDALSGEDADRIDEALARATFEDLDPKQQRVARFLVERLGLGDVEHQFETVKQNWEDFKSKVRATLHDVTEQRIAAGFRYEYLRADSKTSMLQVVVPQTVALDWHGKLLLGDLTVPMAWVASHADSPDVQAFLLESRTVQKSAWGFTLGMGRFKPIAGKDTSRLERIVQHASAGERVAFLGQRGYDAEWFGRHFSWTVDFKADTGYVAGAPRAADLYYGLHLMYCAHGVLDATALRMAIDEAIAWRVLDDADEEELYARLAPLIDGGRKVTTRLELKLDDAQLRAFLGDPGSDSALALALARSMPWVQGHDGREVVAAREALYAPLWKTIIKSGQSLSTREIVTLAATNLRANPQGKDLEPLEKDAGNPLSLAFIATKSSRLRANWDAFVAGAGALTLAIASGWDTSAVAGAFAQLQTFWQQQIEVRALGALITSRLDGAIERSFSVTPDDGSKVVIAGV